MGGLDRNLASLGRLFWSVKRQLDQAIEGNAAIDYNENGLWSARIYTYLVLRGGFHCEIQGILAQ